MYGPTLAQWRKRGSGYPSPLLEQSGLPQWNIWFEGKPTKQPLMTLLMYDLRRRAKCYVWKVSLRRECWTTICQPHYRSPPTKCIWQKFCVAKTKSCRAKNNMVKRPYILKGAVQNFCQSSCSQFGFFFGDHGPRVGGSSWLEDGLREIGTWPGGQQMEGHTSRTSGFYKKKYKSTLEMVIFLQTGHATPTIFGHYALSIFHRLR